MASQLRRTLKSAPPAGTHWSVLPQPVLPMGLGYVEGVTHDYVRHGTTTFFAALDIALALVSRSY